ncbi:hypothetical protein KJ966_24415 [bacterium]|nr:hypothetical protein [bacterium]
MADKKEIEQEINRRLQNAINAVINQQIAEKDPPETIETIERLEAEGFSRDEAYVLVGHLVSLEVAEQLAGEQGIDMNRYVAALEKLPEPFAKKRQSEDDE